MMKVLIQVDKVANRSFRRYFSKQVYDKNAYFIFSVYYFIPMVHTYQ